MESFSLQHLNHQDSVKLAWSTLAFTDMRMLVTEGCCPTNEFFILHLLRGGQCLASVWYHSNASLSASDV